MACGSGRGPDGPAARACTAGCRPRRLLPPLQRERLGETRREGLGGSRGLGGREGGRAREGGPGREGRRLQWEALGPEIGDSEDVPRAPSRSVTHAGGCSSGVRQRPGPRRPCGPGLHRRLPATAAVATVCVDRPGRRPERPARAVEPRHGPAPPWAGGTEAGPLGRPGRT